MQALSWNIQKWQLWGLRFDINWKEGKYWIEKVVFIAILHFTMNKKLFIRPIFRPFFITRTYYGAIFPTFSQFIAQTFPNPRKIPAASKLHFSKVVYPVLIVVVHYSKWLKNLAFTLQVRMWGFTFGVPKFVRFCTNINKNFLILWIQAFLNLRC